jgi:hypothetical protein
MQENNKLVQEALIQMKQVEEAIAENAKGILASTMKEEINQLVKESLSEQEEDEVELDVDMDDEMDSDEEEMDFDMDTDNEDEDEMDMDFEMDMDSDESPIDLTGASDEEILRVFKAMGEEDGIIVQKDGEDIHLTDNDNDSEYIVKLGESEDEDELLDEEDDMEFDFEELGEMDDQTTDDVLDAIFANGNTDDIELDQDDEEEVMFEIEFEDDEEEEFIDEEEDDDMMDEQEDEDMMDEQEDEDMMDEEEDLEESYNRRRTVRESKSTIKPKGVGIGSGPKFTYKDKASGGFDEKRKEGPKSVGTGKAKFDYKKGENMEGSSKVVKAETKEGAHGMNKGDKSKTMKGKEDYTTKKGDTLKRKAFEKEETKEAARTYGMGSKSGRGLRKGITPNRNIVYKESTEEVTMLREKNEEYRKALNVFREKLNEVAIFNSNLAYATRLFTEHSTTKKEKINILRRFDDVETLKESKNLYQSIKGELSKPEIKKSLSESVENKIQKTVSTGSSTTLIESKTYENPQFMRMKDLMSKLG